MLFSYISRLLEPLGVVDNGSSVLNYFVTTENNSHIVLFINY